MGTKTLKWSLLSIVAVATLAIGVSSAQAYTARPALVAKVLHRPTHLPPGGVGAVDVTVINRGDGATDGPVTATVELPPGVTGYLSFSPDWDCPTAMGASSFDCTRIGAEPLAPLETELLPIVVMVDPGASGSGTTRVEVSGGGDTSAHEVGRAATISADPAPFEVLDFSGWATDATGAAARQAGGHPEVSTDLQFSNFQGAAALVDYAPPENVKDVEVELPAGLVANVAGLPICENKDISFKDGALCPSETQVGTVDLTYVQGSWSNSPGIPLFIVDPPPGVTARLAFNISGVVTNIDASVSAETGYAVRARVSNASQTLPIVGTRVNLWAIPSDPIHDPIRWNPVGGPSGVGFPGATSSASRRAFVTAPTRCAPSLTTSLALRTWQRPDVVHRAEFSTDFNGDPIATENCESLAFDPAVDIRPSVSGADAPTGLEVEIASPQNIEDPDGLAAAHLKDVRVALPEGMTINPGAANGLAACSDEQIALGTDREPGCPAASKIGTVEATTPVLEETITGGVYVASQRSGDPASGDMFRLFIVLRNDERGILVKLPGRVHVNPDSGRIVTSFRDNPQLPVDRIALRLKGGDRAPLVNPASCGEKAIETTLTSWAGHEVNTVSRFDVPCTEGLGGFSPSMDAGTISPVGGAFSPFALELRKPDGDADLRGLRMELPKGLLANLKGNLGKQVGQVTAYAGPGSSPFALPGRVYLEGPYDGAPFSLRVVVPAVAGPFDLGEVVVRQKLHVDPNDAHVTVVSDPIPTIVKGVPARLQRLDVDIDRPGFVINPTSCTSKAIEATLSSVAGHSVPLSNRFQVGDCSQLRFTPKLSLRMAGRKQVTTGRHPGFRARVTQPGIGVAAIDEAVVTLPKSLALDPDNAQALCEFVDGTKPDLEKHCPKGSIVGRAKAVSPLLERPLTGDVYFVKNVKVDKRTGNQIRTLPMIVVALRGEIAINLRGVSDTAKDGRLVSRFATVPDAPVTRFDLNIAGGGKGILAVTRTRKAKINLCNRPNSHRADVRMRGQNGRQANFATTVKTPCAKTARAGRAKAGKRKR